MKIYVSFNVFVNVFLEKEFLIHAQSSFCLIKPSFITYLDQSYHKSHTSMTLSPTLHSINSLWFIYYWVLYFQQFYPHKNVTFIDYIQLTQTLLFYKRLSRRELNEPYFFMAYLCQDIDRTRPKFLILLFYSFNLFYIWIIFTIKQGKQLNLPCFIVE